VNESTLTRLKIIVERSVRPVRASVYCKRKMREELLAHVSAVFEEESVKLGEEQAALERTELRFGNPVELTSELQESVSAKDVILQFFESSTLRHSNSTFHRAVRNASVALIASTVLFLPPIFWQARMKEWPVVFAIPVFVFCLTLLADWMRQALDGPAGRSWFRATLVAFGFWFLVPGETFAVLLTYSGDARSSLMHMLPLLPWAVLTPVFFVFLAVWGVPPSSALIESGRARRSVETSSDQEPSSGDPCPCAKLVCSWQPRDRCRKEVDK